MREKKSAGKEEKEVEFYDRVSESKIAKGKTGGSMSYL